MSSKLCHEKLRPDGKPDPDSHVEASGAAESEATVPAAVAAPDLKPSPESAAPAVPEAERGVKRAATLTLDMGEEGVWRGGSLLVWLGDVPLHADMDAPAAAGA